MSSAGGTDFWSGYDYTHLNPWSQNPVNGGETDAGAISFCYWTENYTGGPIVSYFL